MKYQYVSDIVTEAFKSKTLKILVPIIQKYDKLYSGKSLIGNTYSEYIDMISTEYHSTLRREEHGRSIN